MPDIVGKTDNIFEVSDVLRIFPTFVWKAQLQQEIHQDMNETIRGTLDKIKHSVAETASGQPWQSDQALHTMDEFSNLVYCLETAIVCVLDFLKINQASFDITGTWANMSPPGSLHKMHSHPNNFLSGVYYVKTHKGSDTINFHDPRPQRDVIKPPVTGLTAENTDQVVITVKNGTILLFPSWLAHSVDANESDEIRISIGFNVMLSDYVEKISKPLWSANG
ncbi:MAG: 2OG-Fe(II) oxygenase family protein [Sneathiella sp.]|nr:2OG-Fe(II) oxygenase family protein [Sneathiella sp.]